MRLSIAGATISGRAAGRLSAGKRGARGQHTDSWLEARILEWTSSVRRQTGRLSGARATGNTAQVSHIWWRGCGPNMASIRSGWTATWRQRPGLEQKAADIMGFSEPSGACGGVCVDEKTAIQALDRRIRCCTSPGRAERARALSTSGTARCPCTRRFDTKTAKCSQDGRATHSADSSRSLRTSSSTSARQEIHVIAETSRPTRRDKSKTF